MKWRKYNTSRFTAGVYETPRNWLVILRERREEGREIERVVFLDFESADKWGRQMVVNLQRDEEYNNEQRTTDLS